MFVNHSNFNRAAGHSQTRGYVAACRARSYANANCLFRTCKIVFHSVHTPASGRLKLERTRRAIADGIARDVATNETCCVTESSEASGRIVNIRLRLIEREGHQFGGAEENDNVDGFYLLNFREATLRHRMV